MKNRMISIGWLGVKTVYLNVSREEAIRRYKEADPDSLIEEEYLKRNDLIEEIEFDDEFTAYDVGRPYK